MAAEDEDAALRELRPPWDVWRLPLLPGGWILIDDAASILGVSRQAVHRMVRRGTLPAWRTGTKPVIFVREEDVLSLPMSPQRRRELRLRGELDEAEPDGAELGDELPEG